MNNKRLVTPADVVNHIANSVEHYYDYRNGLSFYVFVNDDESLFVEVADEDGAMEVWELTPRRMQSGPVRNG